MPPGDCYLDYNATSPLDPEVAAAMTEAFAVWGNPSSVHRRGAEARYLVEKSRRRIAKALHLGDPEGLIFTSGATEANNLMLQGFAAACRTVPLLVTSTVEHAAVLDCARALAQRGAVEWRTIPVDGEARFRVPALDRRPEQQCLVSAILANNEVGTINDLGPLAGERCDGLWLHSDAVQALGRVPLDGTALGVDALTIASHKCGGPKGVGALWRRQGVPLEPLIFGGHQEAGLRPGTENVALIAGFATAVERAVNLQAAEVRRLEKLREQLWLDLSAAVPGVQRNSPTVDCLPNTLNVSVPGHSSQYLVRELDRRGICVSAGSACTSGGAERPSHVLLAMGLDPERASSALRISMGSDTQTSDVESLVTALREISSRA